MRMAELRKNEQVVAVYDRIMSSAEWRLLMDVMMGEDHPMYESTAQLVPENCDSKKLGVIEGYNEFKTRLESARKLLVPAEPLEPSYPNPDEEPPRRKK